MMQKIVCGTLLVLAVAGCGRRAEQDNGGSPDLTTTTNTATTFGERFDPNSEQDISDAALKAWRTATSHSKQGDMATAAWKKQRDADEKSAMDQLTKLRKDYPSSSTVRFMMGQVEEHFGKHEAAVEHFRASTVNNTNNGMYLFKLAESEYKAGHTDEAIKRYRELLTHMSDFAPARVGLARALRQKDPNSKEAQQLLDDVLKVEPDNKEAKALLDTKNAAKP